MSRIGFRIALSDLFSAGSTEVCIISLLHILEQKLSFKISEFRLCSAVFVLKTFVIELNSGLVNSSLTMLLIISFLYTL